MNVIEKIQVHAKAIAEGQNEQVKPGMPAAFTTACVVGDAIRQGDLYLFVIDALPAGFKKVAKPKEADKQLVPGNTQGSKHCLDSLDGVTLYRPKNWSEESLIGPCFTVTKERRVLHPVHGAVTIPADMMIGTRYQREWDKELARESRARD